MCLGLCTAKVVVRPSSRCRRLRGQGLSGYGFAGCARPPLFLTVPTRHFALAVPALLYGCFAHLTLVLAMALGATSPIVATDRRLRILVADDHPVVRKTVRRILDSHPRFEVCGEAQDGAAAIDEAHRLKPDVVVLNITMPVLNGIDAAREINASLPASAIVILSTHADKHFVEEARKSGAARGPRPRRMPGNAPRLSPGPA